MEACVLASAGMNIVWTAASLQTPKMLRKNGLRCLSRTRGRTSRTMGCSDVAAAAIIDADQSRGTSKNATDLTGGFFRSTRFGDERQSVRVNERGITATLHVLAGVGSPPLASPAPGSTVPKSNLYK